MNHISTNKASNDFTDRQAVSHGRQLLESFPQGGVHRAVSEVCVCSQRWLNNTAETLLRVGQLQKVYKGSTVAVKVLYITSNSSELCACFNFNKLKSKHMMYMCAVNNRTAYK